jgi:hypothetical protein
VSSDKPACLVVKARRGLIRAITASSKLVGAREEELREQTDPGVEVKGRGRGGRGRRETAGCRQTVRQAAVGMWRGGMICGRDVRSWEVR